MVGLLPADMCGASQMQKLRPDPKMFVLIRLFSIFTSDCALVDVRCIMCSRLYIQIRIESWLIECLRLNLGSMELTPC